MRVSLLILALLLSGCVVEPAHVYGPPVIGPPVIEVDPFPFVWVGPGWYGGRYYYSHPGHGHFKHKGR